MHRRIPIVCRVSLRRCRSAIRRPRTYRNLARRAGLALEPVNRLAV
jgi:hypothetical protein